MPRKPRDINIRIKEKEEKYNKLKKSFKQCELELDELYKERDEQKMKELFKVAKANNVPIDDVIKMVSGLHK